MLLVAKDKRDWSLVPMQSINRLTILGGRCNDMIASTQMPQCPCEVHATKELHVL